VILADTSAWVEFDRATGSGVDRRMTELIASDGPLAVTEPVLMEVLAGARDDRRADDLRRLLLRCHLLALDPAADFDAAARVHRRCRRVGVTPRGLVDCLVVAVAWRHGASVMARDADVDRICEVMGVSVEPRSEG
jgi:predicted nucleic acid-binding protein